MNITHKIEDLSTGLIHTSFGANTKEGKEIALNKLANFGVKNWIDQDTCKVTLNSKVSKYTKTFRFIK